MNGIWVSGDISRLDGRKPSCGTLPPHAWCRWACQQIRISPGRLNRIMNAVIPAAMARAGLREVLFYSLFQHVLI